MIAPEWIDSPYPDSDSQFKVRGLHGLEHLELIEAGMRSMTGMLSKELPDGEEMSADGSPASDGEYRVLITSRTAPALLAGLVAWRNVVDDAGESLPCKPANHGQLKTHDVRAICHKVFNLTVTGNDLAKKS